MEYDPLDRFGVHRKLEHLDLVRQLQQDEDAFKTALIESITESCLANNPTRINDAGLTIMMFDSARQPSELLMIGDSGYFGRANSEGRQHTIQIAQAAVGPTVMVGQ